MARLLFLLLSALSLIHAVSAQTVPSREDAENNPSKHAWDLFYLVNYPALDPEKCHCRGVADTTKSFGAPGTTVVWETWRLAAHEVFLDNGAKPPVWEDLSLPGAPTRGKVPEPPKSEILRLLNGKSRLPDVKIKPLFDEGGIFAGQGQFGETRLSRATYDYVRDNGLYSVEGQQRYAQTVLKGEKPPITFPVDSMEVKAAWVDIADPSTPDHDASHYYTATFNGKVYGLASLHIITKDIPNWFWATFHHVSNPAGGMETPDTYGRPKSFDGTVWRYYRLGGTQTNFIDPIGRPTLLSDSLIEKGIERSSCISCHARATIAPEGFFPIGNSPVIGSPHCGDYIPGCTNDKLDGAASIVQTDFLFSLVIRARHEAK